MSQVKWTVGIPGNEEMFSSGGGRATNKEASDRLKRNGYIRMGGGYLPISYYGALLYDSLNPVHEYFASIFYVTQVLKARAVFGEDNTPHEEMVKLLDPENYDPPEGTIVD